MARLVIQYPLTGVKGLPATVDLEMGDDQRKFFAPPPNGKRRVGLGLGLQYPLSRGTVHITSSDPAAHPRIDTGYLKNPVDAKIFAEGIKWLDKVSKQPVFARSLADRVSPPPDASIATEDERVEFVRSHMATQYHNIGTCALGEVVDNELKVRGVNRLRIIDSSVFPAHLSGNIMATVYAVAEKGADLVKKDDGRF